LRAAGGSDDQDGMPMELECERESSLYTEEMKANQEEVKKSEGLSYLDKCKKIGRIGPKQVRMNKKSAHGKIYFKTIENLDVEAISSFVSIRANVGVFSGRYYYETQIKTSELMQIGWCTL